MAITNAQQYQQLVNKPANGKRPGYRGSSYGSPSRSSSQGPAGGASSGGNYGGNRNNNNSSSSSSSSSSGRERGADRNRSQSTTTNNYNYKGPADLGVTTRTRNKVKAPPPQEIIGGKSYPVTNDPQNVILRDNARYENNLKKEEEKNKFITTDNTPSYVPGYLKFLAGNNATNRKFFYDKVIGAGKYPGLNYGMDEDELEQAYQDYMSNRMAGKTDAYGNPTQGFSYDIDETGKYDLTGNFIDDRDDGAGQQNLLDDTIEDKEDEEDEVDPRDYTGIAPRFMGSIFDFSGPQFAADGGIMRAGYMDGGRMRQMEMMQDEDDPEGGIMDLESGRQMYFLGKLVKKAGRAIKKVVKSPIGKAALLYFGGNALMGAGGGKGLSSFFGKGSFNPLKALITKGPQTGKMGSSGLGRILGKLGLAKEGSLTLAGRLGLNYGLPFALSAMSAGKDKDEDGPINYGLDIDIDAIRANPYKFLPAGIIGSNYQRGTEGRKDGGRMGYQEGGDAEPVAKKTMPLLDMGGMEKDYREEGGFVPIGRMERADDVPARLSKNEFVFTADAVRNAGDGDIDKGAEVMYNMMKNLESGGEVSEESQGLDGAREMFQTSKRLEEVL